jgi:hypothetical protein
VPDSPRFVHPAYVVYPRQADNGVLAQAVQGIRELADAEQVVLDH